MSSKSVRALTGKRVYPITNRPLSKLSHAQQVSKLIEAGATIIQLREKMDSPAEFYHQAEAALPISRKHGVPLIINDRADIALALQADGVHLGQEDLPPEAARRLLGPACIIGFSTHNLHQAKLAARMPIDYIAIGPIFATTTKASSNPPVGLESLSLIREAAGLIPLVAIGGITTENMAAVLNAGAAAVSLISEIWTPQGRFELKMRQILGAA